MKKIIWHLIVINESMDIVTVASYPDLNKALDALRKDYEMTKEVLKEDGWNEDNLNVDELNGSSYWIEYGENSYYGEVCASQLHEEEE